MILWKAKKKFSNDPADYCSVRRMVLEIGWSYLSWMLHYKPRDTGKWTSAFVGGWHLCLMRTLLWGSHHTWYDGPNCNFSIGFLRINWNSLNCKHCHAELYDDSPEHDGDYHEDDT